MNNTLRMADNLHEQYFQEAGRVAMRALCQRDRCGAVIVKGGKVIAEGYNAPPLDNASNMKCALELRESPKPKSDRTCCLHAEWRAIIGAIASGTILKGSTLYFTRIDEGGALKRSGMPYCTVCSRLALDVGIAYFGLWQEGGIMLYETKEYNDKSYEFHTLSPH